MSYDIHISLNKDLLYYFLGSSAGYLTQSHEIILCSQTLHGFHARHMGYLIHPSLLIPSLASLQIIIYFPEL